MSRKKHDKLPQAIDEKKTSVLKLLTFWERQKNFSTQLSNKLNDICELMKVHSNFLEEAYIQHVGCFGKKNNFGPLIEGFSFLTNNMEQLQNQTTKAFEKTDFVITELKQEKKTFSTSKNEEALTSSYYKLQEYLRWETPLLFINFFHAFSTLFSTGELFFSCDNDLTKITDDAQKKKQEFVMKNTNLKPTVLYCNTTIKQILDSERRPFYQLPRVIEQMLVYLYNKGCTTHGLFREVSSASAKEIDEIFHRMSVTDFEDLPPDVVANVLKKFLRELKEKVFKFDMSSFMLTEWQRNRAKKRTSNADKRQIVLTALKKTPPEHVTMLRSLLKLCNKIDSMSDINAMTNKNLAVCLAPTLMTLSQDTSSKTMDLKTGGEIVGCIEIVTFIFNDFIHLFPEDVDDNVTRRSRRMSQRLVTCLVEGMNEEEKIFKGIVEAKQSKDPSKANATEQEAEAERTKVPEELLIEIRNPTSPHPKISPRKMPQKPSAPISVSPVNKPASSQFLRTNPTSNQDSIVPSVHLIGTKKDIDSKDQLQKQNSPRKPPPRKLPPVPHPQAKTLPQGFTNPHHPPRTALNDDSSQQQVSENIGDTTSDNVGDAVVGNYTVDNPPPVPPRRNPMRTSNSNSQGTSPRQETL